MQKSAKWTEKLYASLMEEGELPPSGLYTDVPFEQYLKIPILSQSTVKVMKRSPLHAQYLSDNGLIPSDDMQLGSALHTAFLEPELMLDRVVEYTGKRRAGKEWTEFKEEHDGKIILTSGYHAKMKGMVKSLREHPFVKKWQSKMEGTEVVAVGEYHGMEMKGRCDALTSNPLVDLKKVSANSFSPHAFAKDAYKFSYHIQAALYTHLFQRDRFILLAVEDQPPHDVVPYELVPELIAVGHKELRECIEQWELCEQLGKWPGIADEPILMEVPNWLLVDMLPEMTITEG